MDQATKANRLQELRVRAGLSPAAIADHLGIGEVQVKRWEANAVLIPTKHLERLCELLDCTVDHLLGLDREPAGRAA